MTIFINGRFLTQPVSGVQRYAREVLGALDRLLADRSGARRVEVLVPRDVDPPDWRVLQTRVVRGGSGHRWEQGALYRASRDGVLLSLGNSGPLRHRAHILCLHDANLFEIPEAFSASYRAWHRMLRPALARRAAALLTVSEHSAEELSRHLGVASAWFEIVPNSAEHVLNWPVGSGVPKRYGLRSGGYFLSVGNQSPNKNIARLVAAHAQAQGVPPLVIVGSGVPGVAHAKAGQGAGVHVLGRVPDADLRGLYEGAAGFVFPSLYEGFGIPPLEAMQLGVPVLCARSGAMPQVLGQGAAWFDPRDVNDMTRALEAFAAMDSADRVTRVVIGRAVAAQYRWSSNATRILEVIDWICRAFVPPQVLV